MPCTCTKYSNKCKVCEFKQKFKESTGTMRYQTKGSLNSFNSYRCFDETPGIINYNSANGVDPSLVDVESDINNLGRKLSDCDQGPFKIYNTPKDLCISSESLSKEYTREKRPCNVLSGIQINRFDILCENPQNTSNIQNNSFVGINTRYYDRELVKNKSQKERKTMYKNLKVKDYNLSLD